VNRPVGRQAGSAAAAATGRNNTLSTSRGTAAAVAAQGSACDGCYMCFSFAVRKILHDISV